MKMRDAKYRAYRKVMPLKVPSNNSDPLRQSPLTAEEITLCDELKRIALDMYYDERVCLLLAEKCREELCNKQATLITLQEVITRFIRMHPQRK